MFENGQRMLVERVRSCEHRLNVKLRDAGHGDLLSRLTCSSVTFCFRQLTDNVSVAGTG